MKKERKIQMEFTNNIPKAPLKRVKRQAHQSTPFNCLLLDITKDLSKKLGFSLKKLGVYSTEKKQYVPKKVFYYPLDDIKRIYGCTFELFDNSDERHNQKIK
ncbi:MAG: hypothetical protein U9O98_11390 [Asgard group archaeon]|nr:hypothetical protein [Asgard group archaeon]